MLTHDIVVDQQDLRRLRARVRLRVSLRVRVRASRASVAPASAPWVGPWKIPLSLSLSLTLALTLTLTLTCVGSLGRPLEALASPTERGRESQRDNSSLHTWITLAKARRKRVSSRADLPEVFQSRALGLWDPVS